MEEKQLGYQRYQIEIKKAENIVPHPYRFKVNVKRGQLAKLLVKELFHYKGNMEVLLSRPCLYGVFSGPVGGFMPREHLCVGCLRCTTQYPEMCQISHNPDYKCLGDSYFTALQFDTVVHEAETGQIPIKGAGYRGTFGGEGWDGMWTDMSEIVRPTRDGIHSREYISTEIDIGLKFPFLKFDAHKKLIEGSPRTLSIQVPFLFDVLPSANLSETVCRILADVAKSIQTLAVLPLQFILNYRLANGNLVPLIAPKDAKDLHKLEFHPSLIEMERWDNDVYAQICHLFPNALIALRTDFEDDLLSYYKAGVRIFHLEADYHGKGKTGGFVLDMIRNAHRLFVAEKCREEITLIGSGGFVAAEHVPKGIFCGLDAVGLDTPLLAALQGRFKEKCASRQFCCIELPDHIPIDWGRQRITNLAGSWRDQLLEVLGAMGLREVRRLRGETGRAMFQKELENEAFAGIHGYE